jgi:hypothetical protein
MKKCKVIIFSAAVELGRVKIELHRIAFGQAKNNVAEIRDIILKIGH